MFVVEPGKLIGSVAPLFGGVAPVMSLVVVLLRGGIAVGVVRVARDGAGVALGQLAALVAREGAQAAAAVFVDAAAVDAGGGLCVRCGAEFEGLAQDLATELNSWGLPLVGSFVVDRVAERGRWFDLGDRSVAGVLDDPVGSVVGLAVAAAGGRLVGGCRDAALAEAALVVRVDAVRVAAVSRLLTGRGGGGFVMVESAVRFVVLAARRHAEGGLLGDGLVAWLGGVLMDAGVRVALFGLVDSVWAGVVEGLWGLLSRVLPLPFRVEALALLALFAFVRGDVVLAGVVLVDVPGHRVGWLVGEAVRRGVGSGLVRGFVVEALVGPAVG